MKLKISNETLTGVFGAVAITVLILGYNFLKGNQLFTRSYDYFSVFENTEGLNTSNPIIFNGLKIGSVKDLQLDPKTGKIVASLKLNADLQLPKGTIAKIVSADLLGSKAIELIFPDQKSAIFHLEKDTLLGTTEVGLTETVSKQVQPVKEKAEKLLGTIDSLATTLTVLFSDNKLQKSLVSITSTLENIDHSTGTFDTLLTTQTNRIKNIVISLESITNNFKNNNENITKILNNINVISDSLTKANFVTTIANANLAIVEVKTMVEKINAGKGSLGELVNDDKMYKNLTSSSANLDKLLIDLKERPWRYLKFALIGGGGK